MNMEKIENLFMGIRQKSVPEHVWQGIEKRITKSHILPAFVMPLVAAAAGFLILLAAWSHLGVHASGKHDMDMAFLIEITDLPLSVSEIEKGTEQAGNDDIQTDWQWFCDIETDDGFLKQSDTEDFLTETLGLGLLENLGLEDRLVDIFNT